MECACCCCWTGLDEVRSQDSPFVIQQIQEFADRYQGNRFAVTCRIAAKKRTFQNFTEAEIADFSYKQIQSFASKWFQQKDPQKSLRFIARLEKERSIRRLAASPPLLASLCSIFEETGELCKENIDALLKKIEGDRT